MSAKPADLHARARQAAGSEIVGVIVHPSNAAMARSMGVTVVDEVVQLPEGMCMAVVGSDRGERVVLFSWDPSLDDTGCELLQSFWDEGLREGALQAAQAVVNGGC